MFISKIDKPKPAKQKPCRHKCKHARLQGIFFIIVLLQGALLRE
jgi:hypothetical protein